MALFKTGARFIIHYRCLFYLSTKSIVYTHITIRHPIQYSRTYTISFYVIITINLSYIGNRLLIENTSLNAILTNSASNIANNIAHTILYNNILKNTQKMTP